MDKYIETDTRICEVKRKMPKNYPTVRRGREVAGTGGIGKVQIIYKPKKPKPYCLMFLGFIVYSVFLGTYFTSFFWSRPQIRGHIIIPIWKKLVFGGDYVRLIANNLLRQDTVSSNIPTDHHELSGSSEEAVIYQQGYVHAKERLFQMDVYRRMALGTLTEVFGNKTLHLDTFACTIDFKRAAYKAFETLADEPAGRLLTAYARGVNDAITNEFRGLYPIDSYYTHGIFRKVQLEAWEPVHSLAILHWLTYHQSHGWEDQVLAELVPRFLKATHIDETAMHELFGDRLEALSASALASSPVDVFDATAGVLDIETVGGSFFARVTNDEDTATTGLNQGRSILTGVDSWGNVKALGFWYANRLTTASGDLDVRGASFPGVPMVLAGTTGHATWFFSQQPARLAATSPAGDLVRFVVDGSDADAAAVAVDATLRRDVIRLREVPTPAIDSDGDPQQHRLLLEVLVNESAVAGIDVLPLLAPEVKAACAQLNVSQVWLRSPLVTDADRVLVRLMRFFHRVNHASSAQSIATAHDELALAETLPWHFFATDAHGATVVVPAPTSRPAAPAVATTSTVVAGASAHIRRQLRAEVTAATAATAATEAADAAVFDDVYSPSGALLAQQLLQLLRQHPLVLRAHANDKDAAAAEDEEKAPPLLRNEVRHQADLLAIIALLETFDGRYTPEAIVPSIVETFRMFFLVETTREPLGPLATMFYGAYNVSAVLRSTELEMRDAVSRLLAPYVSPSCATHTDGGVDTCPSGPRVSWWVEQAGGLPDVLQRSLDGALEWLYKVNEARAIATWQWQNHHHLLVHHPVSPVRVFPPPVCHTVSHCVSLCLVVSLCRP